MALLDFLPFGKKESEKPDILPVLPEEIYRAGVLDLQDVIAPHALKISSHELDLGEKIARTFFVISYPRFLTTGWFAPIINMDKVLDISIFVHPMDTNAMLRKFQKKVAEIQSQISTREEKGMVRDPMLDTAYSDIEQLRDSLQQAQERIFDVGLYITIYGSTREEIDKIESEVRSILESRLVYIRPALFQQEQGFRSVLPIATDELDVHTKLNSAPLSSIFPFISFDLTSDRGILYGINRHNSSLILFDRFSLENYNSVTFAKSGAGKSYCTKLEILRSLMFDTEVIVIDPEREYEYLAETVGGRYFNISLSSEHHINPFDLAVPHEDENPSDVLRNNIITLVGLFRIMLGGLTPEEDAIIDKAITETYALKDITADSNFAAVEPPLLSDFELVLSGMEGSESLVNRLSKYTKGTWSGFMNRPTNVDMNKKLVVFSVRDMEDDLKPVAMYIITHHIWNAVRKELRKRLLVIDEAWWMMRSEDTASFLFGIAKRGRKYYLGISTITQDVSDFLNSPYGVPMITNSSIQLLLRQSPTSVDLVQQTFKLSDEEKYLLLESDVGEGIFFAGLKHVAIKIIASYTEDQIITSDPSQILAIKKARTELDAVEAEAPITELAPEHATKQAQQAAPPHAIPAELVPEQPPAAPEPVATIPAQPASAPAPAAPTAAPAIEPASVPPATPEPAVPPVPPAEPVAPTPKPEQPHMPPPQPAAPIDPTPAKIVPEAPLMPAPAAPVIAKSEPIALAPTPITPALAPAPASNPAPAPMQTPAPAAPVVTPPPPPSAPPAAPSGNPAITIKPPAPGAERTYEISNVLAQLDDKSA